MSLQIALFHLFWITSQNTQCHLGSVVSLTSLAVALLSTFDLSCHLCKAYSCMASVEWNNETSVLLIRAYVELQDTFQVKNEITIMALLVIYSLAPSLSHYRSPSPLPHLSTCHPPSASPLLLWFCHLLNFVVHSHHTHTFGWLVACFGAICSCKDV